MQSYYYRWSETAHFFTYLANLPANFEIPICPAILAKKCQFYHKFAPTTQIMIKKIRKNFLIKGISKQKLCMKFDW